MANDIRTPKEVIMKKNTKAKKEFKTVEFMREVRNELSEEFLSDKKKYLKSLKDTMSNFKLRQIKANQ